MVWAGMLNTGWDLELTLGLSFWTGGGCCGGEAVSELTPHVGLSHQSASSVPICHWGSQPSGNWSNLSTRSLMELVELAESVDETDIPRFRLLFLGVTSVSWDTSGYLNASVCPKFTLACWVLSTIVVWAEPNCMFISALARDPNVNPSSDLWVELRFIAPKSSTMLLRADVNLKFHLLKLTVPAKSALLKICNMTQSVNIYSTQSSYSHMEKNLKVVKIIVYLARALEESNCEVWIRKR